MKIEHIAMYGYAAENVGGYDAVGRYLPTGEISF